MNCQKGFSIIGWTMEGCLPGSIPTISIGPNAPNVHEKTDDLPTKGPRPSYAPCTPNRDRNAASPMRAEGGVTETVRKATWYPEIAKIPPNPFNRAAIKPKQMIAPRFALEPNRARGESSTGNTTMQQSYATALKSAQELITQQSDQLRSALDELQRLQQSLVKQCSTTTDREIELAARTQELEQARHQVETLDVQLGRVTVAREQAEALVDRQAARLGKLADQIELQATRLAEQTIRIDLLTLERDQLLARLPSSDDELALASLSQLLAGHEPGRPVTPTLSYTGATALGRSEEQPQ